MRDEVRLTCGDTLVVRPICHLGVLDAEDVRVARARSHVAAAVA